MIRSILVPLDGSEFSERALPVGCELARAIGARLVLVCVAGPGLALDVSLTAGDKRDIAEKYANVREEDHLLSTDPRMVERMVGQVRTVAEAEAYLAGVAARLAEANIQIETGVPYGSATEGILTEIDIHSVDLVVMSTHGRSGFSRLISGSVAQAVLARSRVPVLLVPPQRPQA
jgi:nucleotide-binding universal stress UspA family protein